VIKTRAREKDTFQSQNGAAVLLVVLVISTGLLGLALGLAQYEKLRQQAHGQLRLAIATFRVMDNFGMLAQRAHDLWLQNQSLGGCPGGTELVQLTGSAIGFCFPPSPICDGAICLDSNITVMIEQDQIFLDADYHINQQSWFISLIEKINFVRFSEMLSPIALAQRVSHIPSVPPPGLTNINILTPVCPGGFGCKSCDGISMHCITLRVCPKAPAACAQSDLWIQTYGMQLN
jgi:hypothetical protein